jgi:hypothetical protein
MTTEMIVTGKVMKLGSLFIRKSMKTRGAVTKAIRKSKSLDVQEISRR